MLAWQIDIVRKTNERHFTKSHKAAAEGPTMMMALLDTVALSFGYSCAFGTQSDSSRTSEGRVRERGEGWGSSLETIETRVDRKPCVHQQYRQYRRPSLL